MPRRPAGQKERPTMIQCSCGGMRIVRPVGRLPTVCEDCEWWQALGGDVRWRVKALLARPAYRSTDPMGDAALLRAMADRLDPREPSDVIDDVLDGLAAGVIAREKAAGLARRLNRARMALARAAGVMR